MEMITAMLVFGSIGLFVRAVDIPSSALALIRGGVGTLFLLFAGIVLKRRISFAAVKKNLGLLLFSGAAIGANWICLFESYRYTTIATATLCYYLAPVFVMLCSPFLLKEKLTPLRTACIAAALLGMFLVGDKAIPANGGNDGKGIAFGLAAAALYASVVLANKFLKDIKAMDMTAVQLGTAALVLLPYVLLTADITPAAFDGRTVALLLVLGIVHTGAAYLLYFSSLQGMSGQLAAVFSYIDPLTAILLSALFLGEKMTGLQALGAVLILGGAFTGALKSGE